MTRSEARWWIKGYDNWPLYHEARWSWSEFHWGTPSEAWAWQKTLRPPIKFESTQLYWWDPARRAWRTYWDLGGDAGDLGREQARNLPEWTADVQALVGLGALAALTLGLLARGRR